MIIVSANESMRVGHKKAAKTAEKSADVKSTVEKTAAAKQPKNSRKKAE